MKALGERQTCDASYALFATSKVPRELLQVKLVNKVNQSVTVTWSYL